MLKGGISLGKGVNKRLSRPRAHNFLACHATSRTAAEGCIIKGGRVRADRVTVAQLVPLRVSFFAYEDRDYFSVKNYLFISGIDPELSTGNHRYTRPEKEVYIFFIQFPFFGSVVGQIWFGPMCVFASDTYRMVACRHTSPHPRAPHIHRL